MKFSYRTEVSFVQIHGKVCIVSKVMPISVIKGAADPQLVNIVEL